MTATETADAGQLLEDAQALLAATADIAEEKVVAARKRLAMAVESGKEVLEDLKDKAIAGAKESSQAQAAAIAQKLFAQGVDLSRIAAGEWETILKTELSQDAAFNAALGRFARFL